MTYYSHSRLDAYNKCSYYYFLYYLSDLEKPLTDTVATVMGGIVHTVMEQFYSDVFNREVPVLTLLDGIWADKLRVLFGTDEFAPPPFFGYLKGLARDWYTTNLRASSAYTGPNPIRDKNGYPFKSPQRSRAWADALKAINFEGRSAAIDATAGSKDRLWAQVSLTQVFAETYTVLGNFVDTLGPYKVTHIELPMSETEETAKRRGNIFPTDVMTGVYNEVRLPSGALLHGYIDKVVEDQQGCEGIVDHKTSRGGPPTVLKTSYWEQLLVYSYACHQLTGRWPAFIGLNFLRDGKLTVAPLDPVEAMRAVGRREAVIRAIEAGVFIQRNPTDFDSPCLKGFGGKPCPFLAHCHPRFSAYAED